MDDDIELILRWREREGRRRPGDCLLKYLEPMNKARLAACLANSYGEVEVPLPVVRSLTRQKIVPLIPLSETCDYSLDFRRRPSITWPSPP